jgi:hypothetical protein
MLLRAGQNGRCKEATMMHGIDTASTVMLEARSLPAAARKPFDAVFELSAGLAPTWQVERAIDYAGDISFIALPGSNDPGMAAFIIFERDGRAHIGTVRNDAWHDGRSFATLPQAVKAIIAQAAHLPDQHAPDQRA